MNLVAGLPSIVTGIPDAGPLPVFVATERNATRSVTAGVSVEALFTRDIEHTAGKLRTT